MFLFRESIFNFLFPQLQQTESGHEKVGWSSRSLSVFTFVCMCVCVFASVFLSQVSCIPLSLYLPLFLSLSLAYLCLLNQLSADRFRGISYKFRSQIQSTTSKMHPLYFNLPMEQRPKHRFSGQLGNDINSLYLTVSQYDWTYSLYSQREVVGVLRSPHRSFSVSSPQDPIMYRSQTITSYITLITVLYTIIILSYSFLPAPLLPPLRSCSGGWLQVYHPLTPSTLGRGEAPGSLSDGFSVSPSLDLITTLIGTPLASLMARLALTCGLAKRRRVGNSSRTGSTFGPPTYVLRDSDRGFSLDFDSLRRQMLLCLAADASKTKEMILKKDTALRILLRTCAVFQPASWNMGFCTPCVGKTGVQTGKKKQGTLYRNRNINDHVLQFYSW